MAKVELPLSSKFLRMLGEEWRWKADAVLELESEQLAAASLKTAALAAAEAAASAHSPRQHNPQSSGD